MNEAQQVIPAGSLPPSKDTEQDIATPEEKLYAGKYKSPEDLEKAHSELEKKLGEQGNELGTTRKQYQDMVAMMQQNMQRPPEQQAPAPGSDYEAQMMGLKKAAESGELDFETYVAQTNQLTAAHVKNSTLAEAKGAFEQMLKDRDSKAIQKQFLDNNPDFTQLKQDGTLDKVKAKNPLHDDFSAYYEWKASAEYQRGKEEAVNLKSGSENTKKVLTRPGTAMQNQNKSSKPLSETDAKARMRQRLAEMREG